MKVNTAPAIVLSTRMRHLATKHQFGPELNRQADALDKAWTGFMAEPQTVSVAGFVGAWARARRFWCQVTGEELV